jgi:hypothetical protein
VYSAAEPPFVLTPQRRIRPWKVILVLVMAAVAGMAIMLQVRGWTTLQSEAGGACGTSNSGAALGACGGRQES